MRNATPPLPPSPPPLSISEEKVCYVIVKTREFDVKDVVTEQDPGSNASDDGMIAVLEDHGDDPVGDELAAFIDSLNEDERIDLVTLLWLGRGDGTLADWAELREEAERADNGDTAAYLLRQPLASDYLSEALSLFGLSCDEYDTGRL